MIRLRRCNHSPAAGDMACPEHAPARGLIAWTRVFDWPADSAPGRGSQSVPLNANRRTAAKAAVTAAAISIQGSRLNFRPSALRLLCSANSLCCSATNFSVSSPDRCEQAAHAWRDDLDSHQVLGCRSLVYSDLIHQAADILRPS